MSAKKPTVLFVCTGNVCRSPAAELLLKQLLGTSASRFTIRSAGTKAVAEQPVDPTIASLLVHLGVRVDHFRSRALEVPMISSADLILTASTSHRAAVARLHPASLRKTLTLKQLARYAPQILANSPRPSHTEQMIPWILESIPLARSRTPRDVSDSIIDPIGRSRGQYEASFAEVRRSVAAITPLLTGQSSSEESPLPVATAGSRR